MNMTFRINWSTPEGSFGWTDIEDCKDMDKAIDFWMDKVLGKGDVPYQALIEQIRPL